MRGAPVKSVQELLGHSSIEMTMRYTRRDDREAAEVERGVPAWV
jgi:integrase